MIIDKIFQKNQRPSFLSIMAKELKEKDRIRMAQFRMNLKLFREERGWSQHDLASRCDVHRSKISALETNENESLTLPTLFELAKGFGIHPKKLIDYPFEFDE